MQTSASNYPLPKDAATSRRMRANRSVDTLPERAIRSALHRRGFRFRKNLPIRINSITVKPDIVFTRQRIAIFIDGCFWHSCPEHGTTPIRNSHYWTPKLDATARRDRAVTAELVEADWAVLRIWEHDDIEDACRAVEEVIRTSRANL